MRAALLAAAIGVAACSGARTEGSTAPVAATAATAATRATAPSATADLSAHGAEEREAKLIARMLKKVSAVRGIPTAKPVPGVALGRDQLIARVKDHVAEEIPKEAIQNEGLSLQLLGLIPTSFDYEAATFALLEAQLAGFYEPKNGTMYLAADLKDDLAEATLAHELVHALQDQKWGLREATKYKPGQSDKSSAFHALAEGDATSAMLDFMVGKAQKGRTAIDLPDAALSGAMMNSVQQGAASTTPRFMQASLIAPYAMGLQFVHALRRSGGWAAVNEAWAHPPETTEQLLHDEKWRAHEPPIAVPSPLPALAGWSELDVDSAGELSLRLVYEEWTQAETADKVARGWGGDRALLAKKDDARVMIVHVRYDAKAQEGASAAVATLGRGLRTKLGNLEVNEPSFACVERGELGPLAVHRNGPDLVIVAGPSEPHAAGPWTSHGTCAEARTWAKAVAAQR